MLFASNWFFEQIVQTTVKNERKKNAIYRYIYIYISVLKDTHTHSHVYFTHNLHIHVYSIHV